MRQLLYIAVQGPYCYSKHHNYNRAIWIYDPRQSFHANNWENIKYKLTSSGHQLELHFPTCQLAVWEGTPWAKNKFTAQKLIKLSMLCLFIMRTCSSISRTANPPPPPPPLKHHTFKWAILWSLTQYTLFFRRKCGILVFMNFYEFHLVTTSILTLDLFRHVYFKRVKKTTTKEPLMMAHRTIGFAK